MQCVEQYELNILPGEGGGIAEASCWAALAVVPNPSFRAATAVNAGAGVGGGGGAALAFSIVFGNSRMAMVNAAVPVPGFGGGGHAERAALVSAGANALTLHPIAALNYVLYVELSPCQYCAPWLTAGGGAGALNPYLVPIAAGNLHVWYRWVHPAGVNAMDAWNASSRAIKLADIAANW